MEALENLSLAKIVSLKPESASLLEKNHLDFCCRGKQTLSEALAGDKEKLNFIKKELEELFKKTENNTGINFNEISLTELADYILITHHRYVKEVMDMIREHTKKIADKHGERHSELIKIAKLFGDVKRELDQHMMKEELILFPRIKYLEDPHNDGLNKDKSLLISSPVGVMEAEHEMVGNIMEEIRELSDNYSPPADACTTYRLAFEELKHFELDLHQHIHLENNILFPKAIELERRLSRINS